MKTRKEVIAGYLADLGENQLFSLISARQKLVVTHRLGLDGPAETLAEVGVRLGVSKSMISIIEGQIIRRVVKNAG